METHFLLQICLELLLYKPSFLTTRGKPLQAFPIVSNLYKMEPTITLMSLVPHCMGLLALRLFS